MRTVIRSNTPHYYESGWRGSRRQMSRCCRPLTEHELVEKAGVFGTVTEVVAFVFHVEVVDFANCLDRDKVCRRHCMQSELQLSNGRSQ